MLDALGLDEKTEAAYRVMLRQRDCDLCDIAGIAEELTYSEQETKEALERLTHLRLLRRSLQDPNHLRAVSPEVGLRLLLQEREAELLREKQELAATEAAVTRLLGEYAHTVPASGSHDVEYLLGPDTIQRRTEELAHRCTHECLSVMPGGAQPAAALEAGKPLDEDLLARGVHVLTLYQDSVRNDQATHAYAQWLAGRGGEVRTVPTLPVRMTLFDRENVLLPIDPDHPHKGTALIHGAGVVTLAAALFELTWQAATEYAPYRHPERNAAGLTPQEADLLRLLSRGHTDEHAARRLGVGLRTVRRMMSDLMGRLDAHSRFEAGALATRHGWLD
ncbi:LuxR C-terminal-related transcriptional regulator [Streptomyces monticola]|uniref:LuxR C-terminal-related transcriptional regulator n=1 Tax=Streptomyces monticola TaxID=2666263 RepID=A0ABW2JTR9_9ACTN